jgi:virginiamycin B lyase
VPIVCSALVTLTFAAPAYASPRTITNYPIPVASTPYGTTTGPDGKIWFVDSGNAGPASIGRMTTGGSITAADLIPFPDSTLGGTATLGPDDKMWVQQDDRSAR